MKYSKTVNDSYLEMNIPPLRSRTPPPLCDCDTIENETDFGAFTMCSDLGGKSYDDFQTVEKAVTVEDSASEDSGLCTGSSIGQAHSPYETSPTTLLKTIPNGETNVFESLPITDSIQINKSPSHHTVCEVMLENNGEDGEKPDENAGDEFPGIKSEKKYDFNNVDGTSSSYPTEESNLNNDSHHFDYGFPDYTEENGVDFEDFQVFQSVEEDISLPPVSFKVDPSDDSDSEDHSAEKEPAEKEESLNNENWDQNGQENDDFDDFCDFQTSTSVPTQSLTLANQISITPFDHLSSEFTQTETEELGLSESGNDQITNVLIPTLQNLVCQNGLWMQIHSLEETPALRFQWNNSSSNRKLLTALKIDSRNILCNLWAKSAKLGGQESIPLNPTKIMSDSKDLPKIQSSSIPKNAVPDAHFDWDGSGLTNPLDCGNTSLLDLPHLSFTCASNSILTETAFHAPCSSTMSTISELNLGSAGSAKISKQAEDVLSLLPDRSYLKKTYIVFKKNPQM